MVTRSRKRRCTRVEIVIRNQVAAPSDADDQRRGPQAVGVALEQRVGQHLEAHGQEGFR